MIYEKNMFMHFLHNFIIKKKYMYMFYSSIALKKNPISQNPGTALGLGLQKYRFLQYWESHSPENS